MAAASSAWGTHFAYARRSRNPCPELHPGYSPGSRRLRLEADDAAAGLRYLRLVRIPVPKPIDALLALACFAALALDVALAGEAGTGGKVVAAAIGVAAAAPIAWRRIAPVGTLLFCLPGLVALAAVAGAGTAVTLIAMLLFFNVAVAGDRRRSLLVAALSAVFLGVVISLLASGEEATMKALRVVLILGALGVGEIVRTRRELRQVELDRQAQLEREREETGRRRIAAERVRIARELHDSLGHALVAINVRAGVARHLGDPESAATALADIQGVSSEALGDLRGTLDLLRENGEAAPTRPNEGLDGVSELVENLRAGGVDAEARIELGSTEIPRSLAQATYRIVQESFTNILRHAGAARATLEVRVVSRRLEIEIRDDGEAASPAVPGHGLRGMVERAEALGGQVEAGPADPGWLVRAELPLDQGSPA
jgi:signal transduction histidine kinase